ncbi:hypothetical protein TBLA_0C06740 [Henningerozyma blattae CBS 6284]|uniref:Clathrin/coatomer adaptor adaptin-like N-terminal domain-containing protein n=1 Tax=Henningerozyma blattae (strain ATCC 34711 / CBS 6284 / DSM 70876 / NBRC 10599 / NRRL Y-10934 / UCD 77-7) TaxID=1071380 RepID=I2H264_HENB6|nr:hypothetical protein TBLA_0C06740 [Tetrapisispora blattae CBS 6284]CCH60466.1 hypothetical protein TBLA_0C06740 [Tetrapisispora blattae CBS 6284]
MVDHINRITSALESARVMTLEAAAVASSKFGESSYTQYSKNISPQQLREFLNSRYSQEVKDGMNKLISALVSDDQQLDIESYFADVIKNINSEDLKVRKLICIFLLRFAERNPNLALLCVNSLQKTLSDINADIRAISVRALSDIKIDSLHPIIWLTLKKAITDSSANVRSEVAFAIIKLNRQNPEDFEEDSVLLLSSLLADSDPQVISSTIILFKECFMNNLELLHSHFRYYCEIINSLDSFAQSGLIDILNVYCKKFIHRPTITELTGDNIQNQTMVFPDHFIDIPFENYTIDYDPDLRLFLDANKKLLFSDNPLVLISVIKTHLNFCTPIDFVKNGLPLLLMRSFAISKDISVKNGLLQIVLLICNKNPKIFYPFVKKFFILRHESYLTSSIKLEILSKLADETNIKSIIREIKYYIKNFKSVSIVIKAIKVLETCSQISDIYETHILKWLINLIEVNTSNTDKALNVTPVALNYIINTVRVIIQKQPTRYFVDIVKLTTLLNHKKFNLNDNSKANIIWLIGEIAAIEFKICPDILRNLLKNFINEGYETRLQILILSAKLLSYDIDNFNKQIKEIDVNGQTSFYDFRTSRINQLFTSIIYLCKFDKSYDIRDRARWVSSLFESRKYEIATLMLQAPKPIVKDDDTLTNIKVDSDIKVYFKNIPWSEISDTSNDAENVDIREPAKLKDYSRYLKNLSSTSFMSKRNSERFVIHNTNNKADEIISTEPVTTNSSTQKTKKPYKLQSLEEFFADIPDSSAKGKPKKTIIIEESSSSDETDQDDDEDYYEDDDEEEEEEDDEDEDESSEEDDEEEGDDDNNENLVHNPSIPEIRM